MRNILHNAVLLQEEEEKEGQEDVVVEQEPPVFGDATMMSYHYRIFI